MRRATGLRLGVGFGKWTLYCLLGLMGITLLNVASAFVGALLGVFPLDLAHYSGLRAALQAIQGGQQILALGPLQTIALVILLTLPLQALINVPFAFGEEWGWRGYLLPRLLPLGCCPSASGRPF
jgi:uncharacterized protein